MERLQPSDDDAGGTGGKLGADEIRFDDTGRVDQGGSDVLMEKEKLATDQTMRSAWLRRVQNDPAEFLSARFAYQLYRDQAEQGGVDETD
jgi:Ca-activated chloride channel family protein